MNSIVTLPHLILIHLVASSVMLGVIWIVQLVHYPAFLYVDEGKFSGFSDFHQSRISLVVVPAMLVELFAAVLLSLYETTGWFSYLVYANLLLVLFVWGITFFISVPCHAKLSVRKDIKIIERLVRTNWLRTAGWTLHFVIAILLVFFFLQK